MWCLRTDWYFWVIRRVLFDLHLRWSLLLSKYILKSVIHLPYIIKFILYMFYCADGLGRSWVRIQWLYRKSRFQERYWRNGTDTCRYLDTNCVLCFRRCRVECTNLFAHIRFTTHHLTLRQPSIITLRVSLVYSVNATEVTYRCWLVKPLHSLYRCPKSFTFVI